MGRAVEEGGRSHKLVVYRNVSCPVPFCANCPGWKTETIFNGDFDQAVMPRFGVSMCWMLNGMRGVRRHRNPYATQRGKMDQGMRTAKLRNLEAIVLM